MSWKAGAATRALPFSPGTEMDGYGDRTGGSLGELRPLEVNVLALSYEGEVAVIVSLDLLAVDRVWTKDLRDALQRRLGLRRELVLVAASHTHAGPAGFRALGELGAADLASPDSVRTLVLEQTCKAVNQAIHHLVPATVVQGSAPVSGVAANRRDPCEPIDLSVTIFSVWPEGDRRPLLVGWHFACHPTVLGVANRCLSPDLVGEVRDQIRKTTSSCLPVIYLNGAAADVSTRYTRLDQTPEELARLGQLLFEALPPADVPVRAEKPAGVLQSDLLERADIDRDATMGRLEEAEQALSAGRSDGRNPAAVRLLEVQVQALKKRLALSSCARTELQPAEIHVLKLGDMMLVAFPGELYSGQGSQLRESIRGPMKVLVVGYASDYVGYLPPADDRESYEADSALVAPGEGERLVGFAAALAESLIEA